MKCSTCNMNIESEKFWVEFPCPKCRKEKIIRCDKCRTIENGYSCSNCNFVGP